MDEGGEVGDAQTSLNDASSISRSLGWLDFIYIVYFAFSV